MATDNQTNKLQCRGIWSGCRDLNPNHHPASPGIARNLLIPISTYGTDSQAVALPAPPAPHPASCTGGARG